MTRREPVLVAPATWAAREAVELRVPGDGVHVIASTEPIPAGTSLEAFARAYGSLLERSLPGYEDLGLETAVVGERPTIVRRLAWTPPGGHRITQLQLYRVDGAHAFVGTATTRSESFERVESDLRDMLAALLGRQGGPALPAVQEPAPVDFIAAFEQGKAKTPIASMEPQDGDWGASHEAWSAAPVAFSES